MRALFSSWRVIITIVCLSVLPRNLEAQTTLNLEPRVEVATSLSANGAILARVGAGQSWQIMGKGDKLHSRDLLLTLPAARAELEPVSKAVRMTLWGNLPVISPYPVLESGVILHDTRAYDLDFTLDRGRVVLTNIKDKGSARVWARLPKTTWDLTLSEPGSEVALELYGRWARGVPFSSDPRAQQEPTRVVMLTVLKGSVSLKAGDEEHLLKAAPGPASFHWDSVFGRAPGPRREAKSPQWASAEHDKKREVQQARELMKKAQGRFERETIGAVLRDLMSGKTPLARQIAVYSLGAIDDLSGVFSALTSEKSSETREAAVLALRQWIGHSREQDAQLFNWLIRRGGYKRSEAETIMQLLHSPFDPDQPLTYQALLAFLRHQKLAVRELAKWHLYRLVEAGRDIKYDAAGSESERQKGWEQWQKLIPSGKLPPEKKSEK